MSGEGDFAKSLSEIASKARAQFFDKDNIEPLNVKLFEKKVSGQMKLNL